jgi:hypothetical protein
MKYQAYPLFTDELHENYEFISEGRCGKITKVVELRYIESAAPAKRYNLALGDRLNEDEIDFNNVTNNGDTYAVLGSIGAIIHDFTNIYPERQVFIIGSDERRSKLYQIHVSNNLKEIQKRFNIYGRKYKSKYFKEFVKGENYQAILVERKL